MSDSEQVPQDTVTIKIAHDGSRYIVYYGKVPPLDGQVYVSLSNHTQIVEAIKREARAEAFEMAIKEVEQWRDLLEKDHRSKLNDRAYPDPQEGGREFRNIDNMLGAVRAGIRILAKEARQKGGV